jgi:sugar/nucleoside kinase (ribokinase family)
MAAHRVLCYGGIAVEAFINLPHQPKLGIAHIICDETYRLGGGSANVAEWLGSWNVPTRLSGYAIGYDRHGDRLWNWLNEHPSIDLSYLLRSHEIDTLVSRTIPFPDGNRYLLCIGYAQVTITPPKPELLEGVSILEIAFYNGQPRGNVASEQMAKMAITKGINIVAMDLLDPMVNLVPITSVIINSAASILEIYPGVDTLKHCLNIHAQSKGVVILTDGNHPIHAVDKDGTHYSVNPPEVTAVETTGAGDSFRAGIIYGMMNEWPLAESLRWATAVSALQVQRSLVQDRVPSKEQIAKIAAKITVLKVD